jgi:hypothetical protein
LVYGSPKNPQRGPVTNEVTCELQGITDQHNVTKCVIRPFAIGRTNWLFSDTPNGATASAQFTVKFFPATQKEVFVTVFMKLTASQASTIIMKKYKLSK